MENKAFEADEQQDAIGNCRVDNDNNSSNEIICEIQKVPVGGNATASNGIESLEVRDILNDELIIQQAVSGSKTSVSVRLACNDNPVKLPEGKVPEPLPSAENGRRRERSFPPQFVGPLNENNASKSDDKTDSMNRKGLPFTISSAMRDDDVETHFLTSEQVDDSPTSPKAKTLPNNEEEDESHPGHCGLGSCQPGLLQKCRSITCFTAAYSLTGMVTSALSAYINSQITALERQFNFSSSVSGFIMSCNDLGYLMTTLIFSYYARRIHIPRALAASTLLYGISGIICTIAYFGTMDQLPKPPPVQESHGIKSNVEISSRNGELTSKHKYIQVSLEAPSQMCSLNDTSWNMSDSGNETMTSSCDASKMAANDIADNWRKGGIAIIAISMILQGIAKSPRQSFVGTYVDDNVPKTKTTLFLGVISGMSIFGPVVAFVVGAVFSNSYVTLEETSMSRRDPRWIGAWWLGFLIFGAIGLVAGIPLLFFPRHLHWKSVPETVKKAKESQSEKHLKLKVEMKGFLATVARLATNPVYVLVNLGTGVYLLAISGSLAFTSKYFEVHFTIPAWKANMLLGAVGVLSACLGSILGGCATSRFRFGPINCLRLSIVILILTMSAQVIGMLLKCEQPDIKRELHNSIGNPGMACMSSCHCDEDFFPTCGADGINYFSPCHAGCFGYEGVEGFVNCTCLSNNATTATAGLCDSNCSRNLNIYVALSFAFGLATSFIMLPLFIVNIRSVEDSDKPLALGVSAFFGTLIGWLPGPVLFGAIVDSTCLIWKESVCGENGACLLYDITAFRNYFHLAIIGIRGFFVTVLIIVYLYVTCTKRFTFQAHEDATGMKEPSTNQNESIDKNGIHLIANGNNERRW